MKRSRKQQESRTRRLEDIVSLFTSKVNKNKQSYKAAGKGKIAIMKKAVVFALLIIGAMLLLPLSQMDKPGTSEPKSGGSAAKIPLAKEAVTEQFRVCDMESDTVTVLSAEEYIFGVVAAEMPATYEPEALKAQAAAAYTFACYRRAANRGKSYDVTTDSTLDQAYISREQAEKRWGSKAEEYGKNIRAAVSAVSGGLITYDGKPILAAYHAISPGKTEDCQNVWGGDYPYLRAVASPGDALAPDYCTTVTLTAEELRQKLGDDCTFSGKEAAYFGKPEKTPSGVVKSITVCGTELKGARIRALLQLRSSAFEVAYRDKTFVFTVYGYGHGVGMSQYGANVMARQGSTFKEILAHYYTGCTFWTAGK